MNENKWKLVILKNNWINFFLYRKLHYDIIIIWREDQECAARKL